MLASRAPKQINSYIVCICAVVIAWSASPAIAEDKVPSAKAIIRGLYPDLTHRGLDVIFKDQSTLDSPGSMRVFILDVQTPSEADSDRLAAATKNPNGTVAASPCSNTSPLLSTYFWFSSDDRLSYFTAEGPAVNSDRMRALSDAVDAHPEWSDKDVLLALGKAGAKFGPTGDIDTPETHAIRALEPFLGEIKVTSRRFELRDEREPEEKQPPAVLEWIVYIDSHVPGKEDLKYILRFEPFEGKIISLGTTPPRL